MNRGALQVTTHWVTMTERLLGFLGGSAGKKSTCNMGDLCLILGLGRFAGGGLGNPLHYSCLENPSGQRSLVGYSLWGCKELDMTEQLSTYIFYIYNNTVR